MEFLVSVKAVLDNDSGTCVTVGVSDLLLLVNSCQLNILLLAGFGLSA